MELLIDITLVAISINAVLWARADNKQRIQQAKKKQEYEQLCAESIACCYEIKRLLDEIKLKLDELPTKEDVRRMFKLEDNE